MLMKAEGRINMDEKELHEKYDRLDNATLRDFIAEFLDRNADFLSDSERIRDKGVVTEAERAQLFGKFKVFVRIEPTRRRYKPGQVQQKKRLLIDLSPVASFWVFPKEGSDSRIAKIKEAEKKPDKSRWSNYSIGFSTKKTDSRSDVDRLLFHFFGEPSGSGDYTTGEALLLKIDPGAPKEEIHEVVDDILDLYGEPRRNDFRRRLQKWKYYLMVYDLTSQGLTEGEIVEIVKNAYPKLPFHEHFNKAACRRYYASAKDLIEGGYKKYVSAAK